MPVQDTKPNFWATLPGILTGVAAVITAAGALFLGLRQGAGVSAPQPASAVSPAGALRTSPIDAAGLPKGEAGTAQTSAPQTKDGVPTKAVRITRNDGTVLWSYEGKFSWGDGNITFDSGQSIPLQRVRAIDILGLDDDGKIKVQVTLADGRIVQGSCAQFSYDLYGENDLGEIRVSRKEFKRVVFPH